MRARELYGYCATAWRYQVNSCKLCGVNPREYFRRVVKDSHMGKSPPTPNEFKLLTPSKHSTPLKWGQVDDLLYLVGSATPILTKFKDRCSADSTIIILDSL